MSESPKQFYRVSIEKLMVADDDVFIVPAIRMVVPEASLETFGVKSTKPFDDALAHVPAVLRPMTLDEVEEWKAADSDDSITVVGPDLDDEEG